MIGYEIHAKNAEQKDQEAFGIMCVYMYIYVYIQRLDMESTCARKRTQEK